MGSWGLGPFENDTGCDWGNDLENSTDLSVIENAIDTVLETSDYLEAPTAEEGLAAAEVVARLKGNRSPSMSNTQTVDDWIDKIDVQVKPEIASKTAAVIDRILTPPSELLELWQETYEFEEWKNLLKDISQRFAT